MLQHLLSGMPQSVVSAFIAVAVHHHYKVKPLLRYVGKILQRLGEEDPKLDLPPAPKELNS